jgi:hypothetical protein
MPSSGNIPSPAAYRPNRAPDRSGRFLGYARETRLALEALHKAASLAVVIGMAIYGAARLFLGVQSFWVTMTRASLPISLP